MCAISMLILLTKSMMEIINQWRFFIDENDTSQIKIYDAENYEEMN